MRAIYLLLGLLLALGCVAQPDIIPQPGDKVPGIVNTINPARPDTSLQAESDLLKLGRDACPQIRRLFDATRQALWEAEEKGQLSDIPGLRARARVLDQAYARLAAWEEPVSLIQSYLKAVVKPEQQALLAKAPEPQHVFELTGDRLEMVFPLYSFFIIRYPQYPDTPAIPPPLTPVTIIALRNVAEENFLFRGANAPSRFTLITTDEQLKAFFLAIALPSAVIAPQVNNAVPPGELDNANHFTLIAWLRLCQELHQDGYYRFRMEDKVEVEPVPYEGPDGPKYSTTGRLDALPDGGNTGALTATLFFNTPPRRLCEIRLQSTLHPGLRPVGQAKKLLNPDPVIRKIAEQDLLLMGPQTYDYLAGEWLHATPELQQAIEGVWGKIVERAAR